MHATLYASKRQTEDKDHIRPNIKRMKMTVERLHMKNRIGGTIFVRENLKILSISHTETNDLG